MSISSLYWDIELNMPGLITLLALLLTTIYQYTYNQYNIRIVLNITTHLQQQPILILYSQIKHKNVFLTI